MSIIYHYYITQDISVYHLSLLHNTGYQCLLSIMSTLHRKLVITQKVSFFSLSLDVQYMFTVCPVYEPTAVVMTGPRCWTDGSPVRLHTGTVLYISSDQPIRRKTQSCV